jgi:hypothetical protein
MSEIVLSLGTQRTGGGLNSCDASEYGSDTMDADTEVGEDVLQQAAAPDLEPQGDPEVENHGVPERRGKRQRAEDAQHILRRSTRAKAPASMKEGAIKLLAFTAKQWTTELKGKLFTPPEATRSKIAKVCRQRASSEWVVHAGRVQCPLYTVLELAEDESWYKEAYGTFNKRKFGLGAVPENGDRVTKFYNKGKAYDGSVTKIYRADVKYRRGGQTRRMMLWEINFDDGDWAELSEIEAVAARQAYLRRTRMPTLFGN